MLSDDITCDKLIADIDNQIEVLSAIAGDNRILTEQLRILLEAREMIINQEKEIFRISEMLDPDRDDEGLSIVDQLDLND